MEKHERKRITYTFNKEEISKILNLEGDIIGSSLSYKGHLEIVCEVDQCPVKNQ